ncbi:hypothetical protein DYB25_005336 [Aphanomyces astaci]|uniref:FYVE-type domain-containing protein n=1 Tax=Aphanomyces astaci TaxID=112090 RepID=A0A396ZTW5_APHAT|nr:hypothetical protein DYB25_005336 [Aphanomyces astaci]RHY13133.1 hypothetical protein DYB36_007998 [Aphanomyces astaci]RHY40341.1 hypothetical protein DYB38_009031 [Aphanomyces astaci]
MQLTWHETAVTAKTSLTAFEFPLLHTIPKRSVTFRLMLELALSSSSSHAWWSLSATLLTDVSAGRWEVVLAAVQTSPRLGHEVDEHGMSLLHYMCMHPALPVDVVYSYLKAVPGAIETLHRGKALRHVTQCSDEVLAALAAAGYPHCAVRHPVTLPSRWKEKPMCGLCFTAFSIVNRRHHCRRCGESVCSTHSKHKGHVLGGGLHDLARICDRCHAQDNMTNQLGHN